MRNKRTLATALTAMVVFALVPSALAGQAERFPVGVWQATAHIAGHQVREGALWSGHFGIEFTVVAAEDSVSGDFESSGDANLTLTGTTTGNAQMHVFAHGTLSGPPSAPEASGTSENTGAGEFNGQAVDMSGSGPAGTITIDIESVHCNEVKGTWTQSFEDLVSQLGWAPSVSGGFVAFGEPVDPPDELRDLRSKLQSLNADWEEINITFALGEGITFSEIRSVMDRAVALENELANLDECEQEILDGLGGFYFAPGDVLKGLITLATGGPTFEGVDLTGPEIVWLTDMALESGLIGPGSRDKDADLWEAELESRARQQREDARSTVEDYEAAYGDGQGSPTPEEEDAYGNALIEWSRMEAHLQGMGWTDDG